LDVLQEVPADQIAGNHEEHVDAYEATGESIRKCMIDENRYDRQCAQALDVAPSYPNVGRCGKFVQGAFRLIMTIAM
jgi:hypothetical protein